MEQTLYELNMQVSDFYHNQLYKCDKAQEYLKQRQIKFDTIEIFKIGYASDENSLYNYLKKEGYSDDVILASGLCSKKEYEGFTDRYKNRIIFPIINEENKVIAFGGRVLNDNIKPKYVNSPESIIYSKASNLYGINIAKDYAKDGLILVEGYFDLITLNQAGIKNVVSALGTAVTDEQIKLISKYTDKVIICFDSDIAGQCASQRAIEKFKQFDMEYSNINLEKAKDADEYINKFGTEIFREIVEG